ncbi:arsenate reductase ArsC [Desulfonatronovibrio magnus]|uniref:arsenate reductase ArsC n=1 Tax=Desulfonatronovibrio magnus TaxID=698827 RepID=UPI0005EBEEF3|nr:arsenate reductase ArsC [Desulfonatronovibrio magnus]
MSQKNILFLCTGNSCRSQMAEAWTNHLHPEKYKAYSAGVMKTRVDPKAIKVMAQAGLDLSGQYSKLIDEIQDITFDYIITLCGHAQENCPFFPGPAKVIHQGFDDPPSLALKEPDEKSALQHYLRVRDEIRQFVQNLPSVLDH